jgi:hypothetical protein
MGIDPGHRSRNLFAGYVMQTGLIEAERGIYC